MVHLHPLRSSDPREIAGYRLHGLIGEGGQGAVFLGVSPSGQQAAVKIFHARLANHPEARRYLERELASVRQVASFCTAQVLHADLYADPPYVVSEFIDAHSLQEEVRTRGVLTGQSLERLAVATATALSAIHAAGVVHRDFKPANVLLAAGGPRVIDFGIARPLEATTATMSGAVGTPAYMAPEQFEGVRASPAMDMFAWACTICFAANGRPPFGSEPLPAVIHRILTGAPELGQVSGRLREYVAASLAKDPAQRPTAHQVLLGLMRHDGSPAVQPPPPPPPWAPPATAPRVTGPVTRPGRRRAGVIAGSIAATLVAGALAVAAAIAFWPDQPQGTGAQPTSSPTAGQSGNLVARSPRLGLEIWQSGGAAPMAITDSDLPRTTATLARGPFELRFPSLTGDRALQICAWSDDSLTPITADGQVADHPCLMPGTGIADFEYGSATLFLNREGHNHLADTRVEKASDRQDKMVFSQVMLGQDTTALAEFDGDLFLTVFTDLNGDGRFDRASTSTSLWTSPRERELTAGP